MLLELYSPSASPDVSAVAAAHDAYRSYIADIQDRLPPSVVALAKAPWHYDSSLHECPHDAWVRALHIRELAQGARQEERELEIAATLLGAYHDGEINIVYRGVQSYLLSLPSIFSPCEAHGDWLVDEIRLSDAGRVLHEVLLSRGRWIVECKDIDWRWKPTLP